MGGCDSISQVAVACSHRGVSYRSRAVAWSSPLLTPLRARPKRQYQCATCNELYTSLTTRSPVHERRAAARHGRPHGRADHRMRPPMPGGPGPAAGAGTWPDPTATGTDPLGVNETKAIVKTGPRPVSFTCAMLRLRSGAARGRGQRRTQRPLEAGLFEPRYVSTSATRTSTRSRTSLTDRIGRSHLVRSYRRALSNPFPKSRPRPALRR